MQASEVCLADHRRRLQQEEWRHGRVDGMRLEHRASESGPLKSEAQSYGLSVLFACWSLVGCSAMSAASTSLDTREVFGQQWHAYASLLAELTRGVVSFGLCLVCMLRCVWTRRGHLGERCSRGRGEGKTGRRARSPGRLLDEVTLKGGGPHFFSYKCPHPLQLLTELTAVAISSFGATLSSRRDFWGRRGGMCLMTANARERRKKDGTSDEKTKGKFQRQPHP